MRTNYNLDDTEEGLRLLDCATVLMKLARRSVQEKRYDAHTWLLREVDRYNEQAQAILDKGKVKK